MSAFQLKWVDPSQAKTIEEFHKQYTEQYGRAMAFQEVYNMLESAPDVARNIAEQIKSPDRDYAIG